MRSAVALPSARTVANWQRQLSGWQPLSVRALVLCLQHVEAFVARRVTTPLDRRQRALLAVAPTDATALGLDALGWQTLTTDLLRAELLTAVGTLTEAGQTALQRGAFPALHWERRMFSFLDLRPAHSPVYVPWPSPPGLAVPLDPALALGVADVRAALSAAVPGFPEQIVQVADLSAPVPSYPLWPQVPVVRAEQVSVVLVRTNTHWLLFALRADGHTLAGSEPAVRWTLDAAQWWDTLEGE
jgi:hypothetical protein